MFPFSINEYKNRVHETKIQMDKKGIDVLLLTDPANMSYLSGYDAWSFYVEQLVAIVIDQEEPIWIGREMDANAASATSWISQKNIISYPEDHVHSELKHPMEFIASFLDHIKQSDRTIGLEMSSYYFSALSYIKLLQNLPNATLIDASLLVNNIRIIKSEREIIYMKRAATIAEIAMDTAISSIQEGVRECDVAATIFKDLISGTDEYGGDFPSIVPLLPSGKNTSAPHLTWTDRQYCANEMVIIELGGCHQRYHAPLARTLSLGKPTEEAQDVSTILVEGLNAAIEAVKPGATCADIHKAWNDVITKHNIIKESRMGYSVGLNYPPDWGEKTASIRENDYTVLKPNMTFHFIPGLWFDQFGIEISETVRVTETGCEVLTNFQRELLIKDQINLAI